MHESPINRGWYLPRNQPVLTDDEVHVWRVNLECGATLTRLERVLDRTECERARRFQVKEMCHNFITARAGLRMILGGYLGQDPQEVLFEYGRYGKPALVRAQNPNDLRFNVSHTHGLALIVVTRHRDVGIDVEYTKRAIDTDGLASHFFSPNEWATIRSLSISERRRAFFACWTRKEAFLKARGEGLFLPLDAFDVSVAANEPAQLLRVQWDASELKHWTLKDLPLDNAYVATMAAEGYDWNLRCWEWSVELKGKPTGALDQ